MFVCEDRSRKGKGVGEKGGKQAGAKWSKLEQAGATEQWGYYCLKEE